MVDINQDAGTITVARQPYANLQWQTPRLQWRNEQSEDFETLIRSYQDLMAIPKVWLVAPAVQFEMWLKLWENVGVAHTAAIEMKEVHYDAKSGEVTNKAAICAWVAR